MCAFFVLGNQPVAGGQSFSANPGSVIVSSFSDRWAAETSASPREKLSTNILFTQQLIKIAPSPPYVCQAFAGDSATTTYSEETKCQELLNREPVRGDMASGTALASVSLYDSAVRDSYGQNTAQPTKENESSGALTPHSQVVQPILSGSIVGTVRNTHGVAVSEMRVTLVGRHNTVEAAATTDSNGAFTFANLPPGTYRLNINGPGVESFASFTVAVGAGQRRELLPIVAMLNPTTTTTVEVSATLNEVAQAQVKQEETQRLLGIMPNFYTSYIWDAAPLTPRLKLDLALRSSVDPAAFLVAAGAAGVEQAHKTFPGYGQEFEGYAKRYGGSYADAVAGKMLSGAIFPMIFHQDPRYFYHGSGTTRSRILYALTSTVMCRGDNGQMQPNYSRLLGSFAAAGLSNLYRAPEDRRASLTLRNGLIVFGSGAAVNLLREFLSRKLTPNVPAFANGKP